jgi:hypothetical protein
MDQVIIYRQDNGLLFIHVPAPECLETRTVMEIAIKDVPYGKPFKIVNREDIPDHPQETWDIDDEDLNDGVGGPSYEFD